VRFVGWSDTVHAELARAQIYVLSSHWEGLPRSILEAMRAGLPVVASDVGGVHELVEGETIGTVVPRGDIGALAGALDRLIEDPALRVRLGDRARAAYEARYTFERLVDDTLQVYERMLGRHLKRPPASAYRLA